MVEHGSVLLQRWRKEHSKTQAEVAKAIGAKQSTVSDWENARKDPHIAGAIALSQLTQGGIPVESWSFELGVAARQARVEAARAETSEPVEAVA